MQLQQTSAMFRPVPTPPPAGPEKPMRNIHVVSLIDASEEVIEPLAVACVENLESARSNSPSQLTGAVFVQRSGTSPEAKKLKATLAATVPRAIGFGLGVAAGSYLLGGLVGAGIGGAVGLAVGSTVANRMFGRTQLLGQIPDNGAEPFWKGSRTYELGANRTDAIDSKVVAEDPGARGLDPKKMGAFLGKEMAAHPDKMAVAHVFGHGLAYRQAAGLQFTAYREMLSQATTLAGRPVDLLLVESCLCGNLESLLATAPFARYALVSEEVVSAGAISHAFSKAVGAAAGHEVTPGQLGQAVVRSNPETGVRDLFSFFFGLPPGKDEISLDDTPEQMVKKTTAETLALVDLSQVEALGQAVDRLGGVLSQEVRDGLAPAIQAASEEAMHTGGDPMLVGAKRSLAVGDLNVFVNCLAELYASGVPSKRPREVMTALADVSRQLQKTVVEASISPQFADSAGLTVQLPSRDLVVIDGQHNERLSGSAAPPRWKEFVQLASAAM